MNMARFTFRPKRRIALKALSSLRSRLIPVHPPTADAPACNICGFRLLAAPELLSVREATSCDVCGSSLRARALMAALQPELDGSGEVRVLERVPRRADIRGIGMSDTTAYAIALERRFDYVNTYFHQPPFLDIRTPGKEYLAQFDFAVSSDVLEHVGGPCLDTLRNLRSLLKPGGLLALTVPYGFQEETVEHFPELHDYRIEGEGDGRVLVNITEDGREQRFGDLRFHGGDGSTLELRYYAYGDLVRWLGEAGFTDIKRHETRFPEWGIIHKDLTDLPITARAA